MEEASGAIRMRAGWKKDYNLGWGCSWKELEKERPLDDRGRRRDRSVVWRPGEFLESSPGQSFVSIHANAAETPLWKG
jgi:hypothetical protein